MQEVIAGEKTSVEATKELGVSERQGWRVLSRVRKKGALGMAHANRVPHQYGVSVTDACIDWKTTEEMIFHAVTPL